MGLSGAADEEEFYYEKEISEKIISGRSIVIYGARIVAWEVANCLMAAPYYCSIDAFMVTDLQDNPDNLLGVRVVALEEGKKLYKDSLIIIAALERYLAQIKSNLDREGFRNVISLGFESDLWSGLRGNYFRSYLRKRGDKYTTLENELPKISGNSRPQKCMHLYNVRCHADKPIFVNARSFQWEIPIQAGAALTDIKIAKVSDDTGDNISLKNPKYCELTALYWIWKNDMADYVGLSHYRRHFDLTEESIERLMKSDIDIVLTIPILNFPNVKAAYENDHVKRDWDVMIEAIKELFPDYYNTAITVQNGIYYYAYNMFISRRHILNEYCEWLFAILDYCEKKCEPKRDKYQNRFLGFLAERLMTIFFIHNKERWKITHCNKNFFS